ncbi:MAG: hypothetical protein KDD44_13245 [Bdellovibrionales bacterium]|nr:hypothetical protein [Bdellovibrionales bacterium]
MVLLRRLSQAASVFCLVAVSATTVAAQDAKQAEAENKDPETIQSGVIASYGKYARGADINATALPEAAGNDEPTPVGASVMKKQGRCVATISNSSEESAYSVRGYIVTLRNGNESSRKFFSVRLGAGKSETKSVGCGEDENVQVVIKSGKRL